jgi:HK97 family phage prohead protease
MHHLEQPIKIHKSFSVSDVTEKNISEESQDKYIEVTGYASRMLDDNNNWVIDADAENIDTWGIELNRLQEGNLPLLYNHDQTKAVGKVLSASYERDGLVITARLYKLPGDDLTNYVYEAVKAGIINSFSVGILVKDFDFVERDNTEYLQLSKSEMIEVSMVAVPANPKATFRMTAVKNIGASTLIAKEDIKQENKDVCDSFECAMRQEETITSKGTEMSETKEEETSTVEEETAKEESQVAEEQPEEPTTEEEDQPSTPAKEEPEEDKESTPEESKEADIEEDTPEVESEKEEPEVQTIANMVAPLKDIKVEDLDEDELEALYEVIDTLHEGIQKLVISEIAANLQ